MIETRHSVIRLLCLVSLALAFQGVTQAERLPIRQYGIIDGLATDAVSGVFRDSRGFMWFCTHAGLSRFDGHSFVNYGVADGLPVDVMVDIAEDPSGIYWVATWGGGGISRFDPDSTDPQPLFTPYRLGDASSERSTGLLIDHSGTIWVGTVHGLFARAHDAAADEPFHLVQLDALPDGGSQVRIRALTEDHQGNLWIATAEGLVRRSPTGNTTTYPILPSDAADFAAHSVVEDRGGRIWVSHTGGITVFRPAEDTLGRESPPSPNGVAAARSCFAGSGHATLKLPESPGEICRMAVARLPGPGEPRGLYRAADDHLWIVRYDEGLTEFDGTRFHNYGAADGLGGYLTAGLGEDPAGNLWLASLDSGALRIARTGFTAFDRSDGLGHTRRARLTESLHGEISVVAGPSIYLFDGERFESLQPGLLEGLGYSNNDMPSILQDRTGEWWFGTRRGLFRFSKTESIRQLMDQEPVESFTMESGLPGDGIACLFEDSSGDIWIGVNAPEPIVRWERATGILYHYPDAHGPRAVNRPLTFTEDDAGQIWVGFVRGLARYRDGRFTHYTKDDGLIADGVVRPYADRKGRLWLVSGYSGVTRIDDPAAERPSFSRRYTTTEGLATNPVICAVDDLFDRIYFCTPKGIDRLDPETGRIRHYTRADGLSTSEVAHGMRDREGKLWFTSMRGVSRLVPRSDPPAPPPPPVWVTGVQVAGVPVPVSELGARELSGLRLPATRNQVRIDFASLSFEVGEEIRYRYRLGGAANVWSTPSTLQSIQLANLSPGRYSFEVRAVNSYGVESDPPATVSFRILPPLWRRGWFLALVMLCLAAIAVAVHRLRIARVIEMERVRTRIATDLHDDIGASLSQIAILTEVVNRRKDLDSSTSRTYLSRIADSSRELVDSMADIVWAINPKRDRLSDLVQKMRRFMGDSVTERESEYTFFGPEKERDLRLGPDLRRQLFLVFKESVNNAVRHSKCARVDVRFSVDGSVLRLVVADDGTGFDPGQEYDGNGLDSMRRRARELGGELDLVSRPGEGTTVRLEVPLAGRRRGIRKTSSPE